jgi:cell division protein FtsL
MENEKTNWEKIGLYIACVAIFFTVIFYLIDMKVDIAKLQVKVEKLEEKKL